MRERAIATIAIWMSLLGSIYFLLERLTNVEYQSVEGRVVPDAIVVQAPAFWQIAIFVLIFFLIIGAFGATSMIWEKAHLSGQTPEQQDDKASAKLKREQKERVRRLLEQMDSDDLAALETRLSDDGEIVSMEELLDQGEFQRRR
jgi:hypothetical protein